MQQRNQKGKFVLDPTLQKLPEDSIYDIIHSPVGELLIVCSDQGLHALLWYKKTMQSVLKKSFAKKPNHPQLVKVKKQLKEYFSGKRQKFELDLKPAGGTDFQKKSWLALRRIPYGKTISYQEQAIKLGDKKKARAAGTANSQNPISIIVPCHRVIAKNGSLSGFGGGVSRKKFLLELEASSSQ